MASVAARDELLNRAWYLRTDNGLFSDKRSRLIQRRKVEIEQDYDVRYMAHAIELTTAAAIEE
jgi:hypothetical protein